MVLSGLFTLIFCKYTTWRQTKHNTVATRILTGWVSREATLSTSTHHIYQIQYLPHTIYTGYQKVKASQISHLWLHTRILQLPHRLIDTLLITKTPFFPEMNKIKLTLGDQIDQISPPPLCKTCSSTSEWIWHTKKYLVNLQKFWELGRPPPHVGKNSQIMTYFF